MMEQYSGDFLAAVDALRALLGCRGRVWPVSVERATLCAEYATAPMTRGEVEVDAGQSAATASRGCGSNRAARIHPAVRKAIGGFDAVIIGPGQLLHQPDADPARARRSRSGCATVKGPIVLVTNLLTEGRGMAGFTAADAVRGSAATIGRPVDVVIANTGRPSDDGPGALRAEHKEPLPLGDVPRRLRARRAADFWQARDRPARSLPAAYAVWAVLSRRLFI